MRGWFGGKEKTDGGSAQAERTSRHSTGWGEVLKRMHRDESLRVLDIGPTSSGNINFITALGHSIYLANLVEDAARREWLTTDGDGAERFDVERFLETHLDFAGRGFDVVLFWDSADFLPEVLLEPVLNRLHEVMLPGGQVLMMFHAAAAPGALKTTAVERADYNRYLLTDSSVLDVQRVGEASVLRKYTNRQIEQLLHSFKGTQFFLSKENIREVVATR